MLKRECIYSKSYSIKSWWKTLLCFGQHVDKLIEEREFNGLQFHKYQCITCKRIEIYEIINWDYIDSYHTVLLKEKNKDNSNPEYKKG